MNDNLESLYRKNWIAGKSRRSSVSNSSGEGSQADVSNDSVLDDTMLNDSVDDDKSTDSVSDGTVRLDVKRASSGVPNNEPVVFKNNVVGHRARLHLTFIHPWTVMKTVFIYAFLGGVAVAAVVFGIWELIQYLGIPQEVDSLVESMLGENAFKFSDYIDDSRVHSVAVLLGVVSCTLTTVFATLLAFFYNISSKIVGGIEFTFTQYE